MIRSYEPGLTAGLERGDARAVAHALRRWVSPHSVLDAAGDTRNGLAWAFDQGLEHTMSAGSVASLLLAHRVLAGDARSVKQLMADPEMDALLNVNLQHCDSGMTPLAAAVRNHDVTVSAGTFCGGTGFSSIPSNRSIAPATCVFRIKKGIRQLSTLSR